MGINGHLNISSVGQETSTKRAKGPPSRDTGASRIPGVASFESLLVLRSKADLEAMPATFACQDMAASYLGRSVIQTLKLSSGIAPMNRPGTAFSFSPPAVPKTA